MKNKLNNILVKSFLRDRKYVPFIGVVCFLSMYLLLNFSYMAKVSADITKNARENDCGYYDVIVKDMTLNDVEKIVGEDYVAEYCTYNDIYVTDGEDEIKVSEVDEAYFKLSSHYFVEGKFPQSEDEIMCEPWYLRQKGIETAKMLGSVISIGGKDYTVTGLFVNKTYSISDENTVTVLKKKSSAINRLLINVEGEAVSKVKYNIFNQVTDKEAIEVGSNVDKEFASKESDGLSVEVIIFVFIILAISTIVILINFIYVFVNHIHNRINAYCLLGIDRNVISGSLGKVMGVVILLANVLAFALFIVTSKLFFNVVASKEKYNYTFEQALNPLVIAILVAMSVVEILTITYILANMFWSKFYNETGKVNAIYEIKATESKNTHFCFNMAKNGLKISKKINIFVVLSISLSIIGLISMVFYIDTTSTEAIDYGNTKYIINLAEDYQLSDEEIEEKTDFVEEVLCNEKLEAQVQNVYITTIMVPKENINADLKKFLKQYYEYNTLLENKLTKKIPIYVGVVSAADVKKYAQINLQNNEAVLYSNMVNQEDLKLDVAEGEIFSLKYQHKENMDITIKSVENKFLYDVYTSTYMFMMVVNDETFEMISEGQNPDRIYIKGDVVESVVLDVTRGYDYVQVENIEFDRKTFDSNISIIKFILHGLFLICVIVVVVNLAVTCLIRIKVFSKEYATLNAIGISAGTIIRIPVYEFSILLVPIVILSSLGSYVSTKILHFFIKEEYSYMEIRYNFPTTELISIIGILICIVFVCILIAVNQIRKQTFEEIR